MTVSCIRHTSAPMKFISYLENGAEAVGILNEDKVVRLNDILSSRGIPFVGTMTDLICAMEKNTALGETIRAADLPSLPQLPAGSIKILAPIPYPRRNIFCLGKNYAEHAAEVKSTQLSDSVIPKYPIYFSKTAVPAIGSGDPIRFSLRATRKVDYEAELAVVIGKEGKDIPPEEAEQYIFGYTILNDVSARDLQKRHEQWFRGKNLDTFCPMGPCLVEKSDFPYPPELNIRCTVNGELRQDSNTRKLIFDIPTIISDLSKGLTLLPGDIISTGTPSGVGVGFQPPRFLADGDLIECRIDGIGTLSNQVEITE